jgi:predicted outer membrane protein
MQNGSESTERCISRPSSNWRRAEGAYTVMKKLSLVLAMAAGFCAVMPAMAQASDVAQISKGTQVSNDRGFLADAAANNQWTVDIAKIAVVNAQSDRVRAFAQHEIETHPDLQGQLASFGVTLPKGFSGSQRKALQDLSNLRGAEFDKAYMTLTIAAHLRDVKSYGQAAQQAQNDQVRQFAAAKLTMLQEHLREAVEILRGL